MIWDRATDIVDRIVKAKVASRSKNLLPELYLKDKLFIPSSHVDGGADLAVVTLTAKATLA